MSPVGNQSDRMGSRVCTAPVRFHHSGYYNPPRNTIGLCRNGLAHTDFQIVTNRLIATLWPGYLIDIKRFVK